MSQDSGPVHGPGQVGESQLISFCRVGANRLSLSMFDAKWSVAVPFLLYAYIVYYKGNIYLL